MRVGSDGLKKRLPEIQAAMPFVFLPSRGQSLGVLATLPKAEGHPALFRQNFVIQVHDVLVGAGWDGWLLLDFVPKKIHYLTSVDNRRSRFRHRCGFSDGYLMVMGVRHGEGWGVRHGEGVGSTMGRGSL